MLTDQNRKQECPLPDATVHVERDGAVATLTLDNPPVNAVSTKLVNALHAALDQVEATDDVRCVVLTGAGERAFCAGGDLREEQAFGSPEASRAFRELGRRTLNRIEQFRVPIVAAIHGYCIGGGTALGWVCDIRIAADNSVFRAGDAYLGLVPSWGMGLTRLPRLVGRNRVLDILLIGENFDAPKAHELGLVTKVVARAQLMPEARAVAERIAKASPTAILATRRAVAYNLRHGWDEMVRYEEEICTEVFGHPDAHEGPKAFTEKRPPNFKSL
jgi:enoyl-CoA hydratase